MFVFFLGALFMRLVKSDIFGVGVMAGIQGIRMMLMLSVLAWVLVCLAASAYMSGRSVGLAFRARFTWCIWSMCAHI